ncbi:hypothetical protein K32_46380 [Kaistia sp. 32K]|uniref:hypothetical protein n=1 Tax=Kaistia sp. 32K TaxID=2795690 RepID=UPI0019157587|nr:hypothetical protein [Kaistia sp. 32K]BCP56021.1 hypothetical protein K32_46380 [Kaistia sp. 32K]
MHVVLAEIITELERVISRLESVIPSNEPFSIAQGNWSFPGLTRSDLIAAARDIIDLIHERETDDLGDSESLIRDYVRRIQFLHQNTLQNVWGQAGQAVPPYMFTLQGLRIVLAPLQKTNAQAEAALMLKRVTRQLRGMEGRLNGLEPRAGALAGMLERIEQANDAADQLPTDLESLAEARQKIEESVRLATQDQGRILDLRSDAEAVDKELRKCIEDANNVLKRCETAYSAATSVGLAAAFTERSEALSKSILYWVFGLVAALGAGSYFGSRQLATFSDLLTKPNVSSSVIAPNLILSLLSVGAPIWFAWLATKQIGQRFRLAEDYAFKASISRAYEGFRREAARVGGDLEQRLLSSALNRLDELPLRLVETDTHGSPWHELASSDVVKNSVGAINNIGDQIKGVAGKAVSRTKFPKVNQDVAPDGS